MLRGRSIVVALAILGAMSICAAQDTADIIVGGQVVARVREAGTYESVEHRAAAADERINQLLAGIDNPASLDVSLEQVDGLWTVVIQGQPIVSVYPSEAAVNGMAPEMLGAMWVRKFKDALPSATAAPVTEIAEPAAPAQPVAIADEPVISSPTTGAETVPAAPTAPPPAPAAPATAEVAPGTVEVLEVPQEDADEPDEVVAGQGARLLILEAFNEARDLSEDDYLIRREAMANGLFDELVQMVTGGRQTGRIAPGTSVSLPMPPQPPVTPPTPAPAPVTPPTAAAPAATAPPPSSAVTPMAPVTGAAPSLVMSPASLAKISAAIPANDAGYANVVQKVAIKAKFRAASDGLRAADPTTRAQAMEVLSAARQANTNQEWATAEQYVDTGLGILGVTQWEQHIDAAMRDLGLAQ